MDVINLKLSQFEMLNVLSGIPYPQLRTRYDSLDKTWSVFSLLGDLAVFFLAVGELGSCVSSQNLNEFTFYFVCFSYVTVSLVRSVYLRYFKQDISVVYHELNQLLLGNSLTWLHEVDFDTIHSSNRRVIDLVSRSDVVMHVVCVLFFTGPSYLMFLITGYKDQLIVPSFMDLEDDFWFGIVSSLQFLAFLIAAFRTATVFGFSIAVINIQISNFRFLNQLLKEITKEAEVCLEEQKMLGDTKEKYYWWVEHHQQSLQVSGRLAGLWGGLITADYAYTISGLLISIFAVATTHGQKAYLQNIAFMIGVLSVLVKWYVFSMLCDRLKTESEHVADKGFGYHVALFPSYLRSNWMFLRMRTKVPVLIKVFRSFPINMATFSSLVQSTFSYYLTLIQITKTYSKP